MICEIKYGGKMSEHFGGKAKMKERVYMEKMVHLDYLKNKKYILAASVDAEGLSKKIWK